MINRAAQFAPFAALTGYEEDIEETQRLTVDKITIENDAANEIDRNLRLAMLSHKPVTITHFLPDPLKPGGSYLTISGLIYKIDLHENVVIMEDGSAILLYNIYDVSLEP